MTQLLNSLISTTLHMAILHSEMEIQSMAIRLSQVYRVSHRPWHILILVNYASSVSFPTLLTKLV